MESELVGIFLIRLNTLGTYVVTTEDNRSINFYFNSVLEVKLMATLNDFFFWLVGGHFHFL